MGKFGKVGVGDTATITYDAVRNGTKPRWMPTFEGFMMKPLLFLAGLVWLTVVAPAWAQGNEQTSPCARARDPARCEMREAALKTCTDLKGADKNLCFETHMAPLDCSGAQNPARCEQLRLAMATCSDQVGVDHRRCLREQAAPAKLEKKKAKKAGKSAGKTRGAKKKVARAATAASR